MEVVSKQSYRRSSRHLGDIGSIPVPRSTAHRWVAESDCDQLETNRENLDVLMADGTGYKRRPDRDAGLNNRGELRVTMGVDKQGNIIPLGAFSGESWENIAEKIKNGTEKGVPLADMLVSDGERGLVNSLGSLCKQVQRCHWHVVRDLNYTMWQDKAPKKERDSSRHDLRAILGIEIPEEDMEVVTAEDSENITAQLNESEKRITELISTLSDKGYNTAADYVKRASRNMFSYVRRWLRTGIVTPRVSSLIERMMREIARRLKRIAFGWSEEGAAKMARVIIKRITSAGEWEKYWKNKLRIEGNVVLTLNSIKHKSPPNIGTLTKIYNSNIQMWYRQIFTEIKISELEKMSFTLRPVKFKKMSSVYQEKGCETNSAVGPAGEQRTSRNKGRFRAKQREPVNPQARERMD